MDASKVCACSYCRTIALRSRLHALASLLCRRHDLHLQRIPDSDSWVHIGVLQGRDRGFVNLTVPQAYIASMQGEGAQAHRLPVPAQS